MKTKLSICVFCGSNIGVNPIYKNAAIGLADLFCEKEISLVYGGGSLGLMGVLADRMLENKCGVIGVIPEKLFTKEIAHPNLTELHVVSSMHERKKKMYDLSDAFITLPGGLGTFDECLEILTWSQLGYHQKPCGLLNINGYFDPLLAQFDKAVDEGFLKPENRKMLKIYSSTEQLLKELL